MKLRNRSLSCRKVAKQLQAYLDGEVDNATHDAIAAHLEMCRDCGLEADTYLAIKASLSVSGDRLQPIDDDVLHRLRDFAAKVRDDSGHGESN